MYIQTIYSGLCVRKTQAASRNENSVCVATSNRLDGKFEKVFPESYNSIYVLYRSHSVFICSMCEKLT